MRENAADRNRPSSPVWRLLSQLKLPAGSPPEELIVLWLSRVLESFNMPVDLFEKLASSIQGSFSRIFDPLPASFNPVLVSLSLLIPSSIQNATPSNMNWGFFRMEKMGFDCAQGLSNEQVIEYYIYLEE